MSNILIERNGTNDQEIILKKVHKIVTVSQLQKVINQFRSLNISKVYSSIAKN